MADTREVIITIRDGGKPKGGNTILDDRKEQREKLKDIRNAINDPMGSMIDASFDTSTFKGFVGAQLANEVVNVAQQSIDFGVSHAGQFTGDIGVVHTVQKIQVATRLAKTATHLGSAAMTGAVAGLPFGGVGSVVGAAVAVGIATINEAISYGRQAFEYNTGTASDSRSVTFIKQRAGQEKTNWSR